MGKKKLVVDELDPMTNSSVYTPGAGGYSTVCIGLHHAAGQVAI